MTALHLHTDGLGYGPARVARYESEVALRRALPASFLFVAGMLVAFAGAQRLLPGAPVVGDVPARQFTLLGPVTTPRAIPVEAPRFAPAVSTTGRVPLPVPDASAQETAPVAAVSGTGAESRTAEGLGGTESGGGGAGAVAADPEPGAFVYTDELPARVKCPAPDYPDMAREAGVEGTVTLWALVDLDGSVKAVQVIRSVPLLDGAATAAVQRWRFTPALANGHPVRVWVAVPVRFSLH